jgi:hypothetical protein
MTDLDPQLEQRIKALEAKTRTGSGFTWLDWFWLILLGAALPLALLVWGWHR